MFVNDIALINHSQSIWFADDVKLFCTVRSPGDALLVQEDLERLLSWSSLWKLSLNPLTLKKQPISHNYKLAQSQLERVANHKDLCIFIDSKLTFVPHVDYAVAKPNCTLGICWRHCRNLDPKTKQIFYYSLVRPGLEFASVCFNSLTVTQETRIERIQNKCIRFHGNNVVGSETVSYTAWLRRTIPSPKPTQHFSTIHLYFQTEN